MKLMKIRNGLTITSAILAVVSESIGLYIAIKSAKKGK